MNDKQRAKLTALGQEFLDAIYDDHAFHEKNIEILEAAQAAAESDSPSMAIITQVGFRRLVEFTMRDMDIHERMDKARAAYLAARTLLEAEDEVGLSPEEREQADRIFASQFGANDKVEATFHGKPFCDQCSGPYPEDEWPGSQYAGHWDTCPHRWAAVKAREETTAFDGFTKDYGYGSDQR